MLDDNPCLHSLEVRSIQCHDNDYNHTGIALNCATEVAVTGLMMNTTKAPGKKSCNARVLLIALRAG